MPEERNMSFNISNSLILCFIREGKEYRKDGNNLENYIYLLFPRMTPHCLIYNGVFEIVENIVVIRAEPSLRHKILKFLLQTFPSTFDATCRKLLFCPMPEFNVDSGVECICNRRTLSLWNFPSVQWVKEQSINIYCTWISALSSRQIDIFENVHTDFVPISNHQHFFPVPRWYLG